MKCDHKKTKMKLVAEAFDCKGKHYQRFVTKRCCALCGCIKPSSNSQE